MLATTNAPIVSSTSTAVASPASDQQTDQLPNPTTPVAQSNDAVVAATDNGQSPSPTPTQTPNAPDTTTNQAPPPLAPPLSTGEAAPVEQNPPTPTPVNPTPVIATGNNRRLADELNQAAPAVISDMTLPNVAATIPAATNPTNSAASQNPNVNATTAAVVAAIQQTPALQTFQAAGPAPVLAATVQKARQENQQLSIAATPEAKTTILVKFAEDKLTTLETVKTNNLAEASFANQRLNQQLDALIQTVDKAVPSKPTKTQTAKAKAIRQALTKLCDQVDSSLRSNQLLVPEDLEQDLEITRGKCFNRQ